MELVPAAGVDQVATRLVVHNADAAPVRLQVELYLDDATRVRLLDRELAAAESGLLDDLAVPSGAALHGQLAAAPAAPAGWVSRWRADT